MAASIPFRYALPAAAAAAATLAYFDARYFLSYDLRFARNIASSFLYIRRKTRLDQLNDYYELESAALDPQHARRPFLLFEGKTWSFREAYDMVLKYGSWLKRAHGVGPGEVVAMDFTNSEVFLWIWLALWSIGAIPAFINYNLTGQPLCHCVKTSTSRLLLIEESLQKNITPDVQAQLTSTTFRSTPQSGPVSIAPLTASTLHAIASTHPTRQPDDLRANQRQDSMALLIYTSGTTGLPKPAIVPWMRTDRGAEFASSFLSLTPADRFFTAMPLYHSAASMLCVLSCVHARCTCILARRFSPSTFWPTARAAEATAIQYVGETCRYLLAQPPSPLDAQNNVRIAFGNGLRSDVWDAFKTRFAIDTIAEFYAATEGVGGTWNLSRNALSAGAIGRAGSLLRTAFAGNSVVVAFDTVAETPVRDPATGLCKLRGRNEVGELLTRIPDPQRVEETFLGYLGNPSASERKVVRDVARRGDAFFRTGDLVRYDAEGRCYFVDRIGDTFRWKSENVSTAEVGEVLGAHPAVTEANVYGVEVPRHDGRCGCAAVVLSDGTTAPGDEVLRGLAAHVRRNLAGYAVPLFLRFTRAMEATGTNKQMKAGLRGQGVDPLTTRESGGDEIYWLRGESYVPFREADWQALQGGGVKL